MFVKICYGPLRYLTVLDVKAVDFTSHLQSEYFYSNNDLFVETPLGKPCRCEIPYLYTDKEFIKDNIGCSSKGNTDGEVYLNVIRICRNNDEEMRIAFTGTAYLCNDTGRTVDTFR